MQHKKKKYSKIFNFCSVSATISEIHRACRQALGSSYKVFRDLRIENNATE